MQLLLQAPGILLKVEQGALALFVLADTLRQLRQLLGQPSAAFGGILIEQRSGQWVRLQAGCQAVLLGRQQLLLLQELFLLGNQAADFATQLGEFFLERVDRFLRCRFFVFIMAAEAVQQRFGLVIRVLMAAAHRARLVIL